MRTVLYFYPKYSAFVASDHRLLSEVYRVKPFYFNTSKKIRTPLYFLLQFIFLVRHMHRGVMMLSQFSGYHTFLPSVFKKIFGHPHYIILHGTECNNFPEYGYGFKNKPMLNWFSKMSLTMASRLLPVSEALIFQEYTFAPTRYKTQGLKAFYPQLKTPATVIHNGVDSKLFIIDPSVVRQKFSFVTVATGLEDEHRRGLKGLDFIQEVAVHCPEFQFTFLGGAIGNHEKLPANVHLIGHVPNDVLFRVYNQQCFYLQWSVSEGFGISLVEAMMCGCVPIVSKVGILPGIVGSYGYVLPSKDIHLAVEILHRAVQEYDASLIDKMRQWAVDQFSLEKRKKALIDVLQSGD